MMAPARLALRCACGKLAGEFDADAGSGARGVCHCDDCQTYARFLGRDDIVDSRGGTEVIQTWPSRVRITHGAEHLGLVRLAPDGLLRFYATCCRAPIANAMARPKLAFVGLIAGRIDSAHSAQLDELYGPAHGVQGRYAVGGCPEGAHPRAGIGVIAGAISLLVRGYFRGAYQPSPLLDAGRPRVEARVLTAAERNAHRPPHLPPLEAKGS